MRFFLDENESPAILQPLRAVYLQHDFRSAEEEGLRGTLDTELIGEVSTRGFHSVLTQDRNQVRNRTSARRTSTLEYIGSATQHPTRPEWS